VEFRIRRSEMMAKIAILGIDLGKNVCSLAGLDEAGNVVLHRRMKREGLSVFAERLALASQHGGICTAPCESAKNDDRSAEAIAEAATRATMRFVELDMQTLHRARDRSSANGLL
jgi:transposase